MSAPRTEKHEQPEGNVSDDPTLSNSPSEMRDLHRIRSQNGYGVDDHDPEPSTTGGAARSSAAATGGGEAQKESGAPVKPKDPYEVGWDGGDSDPECPRSFSKTRKWLITIIVSHVSLCVTCASSIYTATYTKMEDEFHNSRIVSVVGLSAFVLGISFGPMFLSPMSEFYGRRPIYLVSWTTYLIFLVPQAVAKNIATVIVFRFLDGFTGSTFLAVAGGTVGDLFARNELQAPMALFSVSPFIGPSMGPLFGGFINYNVDWRWTYYVLLIWSGVVWFAVVFLVPETYHPILLRNKARRLRKETGDDRWLAPTEKVKKSVSQAVGRSLLRPFQLLFFEPMCLNLCLFSAILLGILYLFFGAFPLVFGNNHGFNAWQIGLSFLGIFAGMVIGVCTDPLWHSIRDKLVRKLEAETGVKGASEPEFRLPPAIMGSFLVPAGIFMFGWSTYPWVHWIVPIIGSCLFAIGPIDNDIVHIEEHKVADCYAILSRNVLLFTGIFTFLVDAYPLYAASALAANAFVRCLFAAAFPLFGVQMYEKLGYQWASSLLAFLTVAMLPFPYIFFRYGKTIRGKSRYAKS
ncbi:Major facilitator superfamily domain, general substrate transporter [Moelleriella libera RCEF 2490]|uniref:Major facilitator superfamily domain, general substrate transporter n=1 Tax=Moelleriella libera RCEF 2490 TaxID=1081109 RepID=A0A168CMR7_9HYPO|nr:Major facilitator superfamily domain, general substrate transporter [Moelleriella libera RCEF 2490]